MQSRWRLPVSVLSAFMPSNCSPPTGLSLVLIAMCLSVVSVDDLKFLTDEYESMAFRRRGYERDALLQAVIARAGFKDLVESEEAEQGQEQPLAQLPEEISRFDLDNFRDRPVQTELVALLLLPKEDQRFASCVLIHGMGGTGKTVWVGDLEKATFLT